MESSLGIITVWYHGEENIDRFVANRRQMVAPHFVHVHVVNALNDDALCKLKEELPESIFLETGKNVGTASA